MPYPDGIKKCRRALDDTMNQSNRPYNFLAIACLAANLAALLFAVIISLRIVLGLA